MVWAPGMLGKRLKTLLLGGVVFVHVVSFSGCGDHRDSTIMERWGASESRYEGGTLVIPLGDGKIQVWVVRDPETNSAHTVEVVSETVGTMFRYAIRGSLGTAEAYYCNGPSENEWLAWRDLDADGQFDTLLKFPQKQLYIYVNGKWVKVQGAKDWETTGVVTEKGARYRFDLGSGKWIAAQYPTSR